MQYKRLKLPFLAVSTTLLLTACGGGSSTSETVNRELIELNSAKVSLGPLKPTTTSSFASHLKNGLYTASIQQIQESCATCGTSVPATNADSSAGGYSQTTTQEAGVDEADRIKYDGDYLYMTARPYYEPIIDDTTPINNDYIKILKRQSDTSMEEVNTLSLPDEFSSVSGLYLKGDKLAAVGSPANWFAIEPSDIWHPYGQKVSLAVYDVQNPESAPLKQSISFDGYLLSSRRVGNKVYLVSSYSPTIAELNYSAISDDEKQSNYDLIQATDINQLMPKLTRSDNTVQNLVEPDSCFIPEDAGSFDGYNSIVTLTTVDLTQPDNIQSVCINTVTEAIYASTNAIYLLGTNREQRSVIHKFVLADSLDYVGAGTVDGYFGFRNPSFRLSEYDNKLRVVTTTRQPNNEFTHQLFILEAEAQNRRLNVVSVLPNDANPEPIGKPGEDIYAVRYFEEKAYIVTYLRIDPLYVLDLANAADPKIVGALEMPGFSSYLHPINENLLLGIGQQIDPNRLPANGQDGTTNTDPIDEGAKVSLFDVSDPSNPFEVGSIVYTNGYTPVEWDHHALTYLSIDENQHRFALPIESWQTNGQSNWSHSNSLQMLEVNITASGAELIEKEPMTVTDPIGENYYYLDSSQDRSVLHGDDVYYIHGNAVIQGNWTNGVH